MFNFIEGMGVDRGPREPGDKACHQPGRAVARRAARDSVSMTCAERDRGECRPSEQSALTPQWGDHPKDWRVWAGGDLPGFT